MLMARRRPARARSRAATPAPEAGLLELGARVRFRHPLVRSAIYRAASPEERQQCAPRAGGGDRSGRSIPIAAPGIARTRRPGLDEDVAARTGALGRPRAGARGPGGGRRVPGARRRADARAGAPRATRAGGGAGDDDAGASDAALGLLATAQAGPLDELQRARVGAPARADRLHRETRPRRPAAAARGRQAARAARRRACPRDVPGRVRGPRSSAVVWPTAVACWRSPRR